MDPIEFSKVQDLLLSLVPPRDPEMQAMEEYARKTEFPIIGPAAGYACYLIARMIHARSVFEMGSGYGYSTAWFARAVAENGGGVVHHVVWDKKLSKMAREHLSRLQYDGIVKYHVGEAVEELRHHSDLLDLVFNDIDKKGYLAALPVIKEKLRPGGVLIVDNILWHGRVFDPQDHTADTDGVRALTESITDDPDWIVTVIPVRDGVMVAYRK